MLLNEFLFLGAFLFCTGVYGVLARKNGVLVLMSIELILNAVNINLIAVGAYHATVVGQVFALFVIAIAAAEVGVGLAIVLLLYRNRRNIDLDNDQRWLAGIVSIFLFGILGYVLNDAFHRDKLVTTHVQGIGAVGDSFFSTYVIPFEVVSVLLLAALVGAIVLARRD